MGAESDALKHPEAKQPTKQVSRTTAVPRIPSPKREFATPGATVFSRSLTGIPSLAPGELPPTSFAAPSLHLPLQRKLAIGAVNDPLELEADAMAERVMRGATPNVPSDVSSNISSGGAPPDSSHPPALRRKCACGGSCDKCKDEDKGTLQRKAASAVTPTEAPPVVHEVIRTAGQPLDTGTRSFMESRFGYDFSQVRIHADSMAARSAGVVQARAYTVGRDVVFAAGHFAPSTAQGRMLLAHELTHVAQQGNSTPMMRRAPAKERGFQWDVHFAQYRGRVMAARIKEHGKLSKEASEKLNSELAYFDGAAEDAYLELVKPALTAVGANLPIVSTRPPIAGATPASPAAAQGRTIQIDSNVVVEIGKGNAKVAETLRNLSETPGNKVLISRSNYTEITRVGDRVTAAEVEARKSMIEKLKIEIRDTTLEQRMGVYENFAAERDGKFSKQGAPSLSNKARKTVTDLPHTANAVANNAELWSFDINIRENAVRLGGKVAPESLLDTVQGVPSTAENILRLIPEAGTHPTGNLNLGVKGPGNSINPPPPDARPELGPKLPEGGKGLGKLGPEAAEGAEGGLGPKLAKGASPGGLSLRGAALEAGGSLAVGMAALVGIAIWVLVIQPKIDAEVKELNDLVAPYREERRKKVMSEVADKFNAFQAVHVGRILRSCWLEKLRAMEKAKKKAFVRVTLNVQFADTRWLLKQGAPTSLFDIDLVGVDLVGVTLRESSEPPVTSQLTESEKKNFVTNDPLWEQQMSFSIEAPTADQIEKEFGKEPAARDCTNDGANSGCFIATACYGSPFAEEVEALRRFRDRVLLQTWPGRKFVFAYYRLSPPMAGWLWSHRIPRKLVREFLVQPLVQIVRWFKLDR
jgi:Domain of unknown function (DUF4157)